MNRIISFLTMSLFIAHAATAAVTLSGKVTKKWSANVPIERVAVKVLTVDGRDVLGEDETDANGDYEISVSHLPTSRNVWIKYELEGWERKPANYLPVRLENDVNHHSAQLSPKNMSDDEAANFGSSLASAERAGEDVQEAQAIASRLPEATRERIAAAYAATFASEQQAEQANRAIESFKLANARYELQRRIASIAYIRERPDGKLALTLWDAYFVPGRRNVPKNKVEEYNLVAEWIVAAKASSVRVEGHADARGSASLNSSLAKERAEAVRGILIDGGVAASAIEAVGMGEANETYLPGANKTGYHNRRVDIVLSIDESDGIIF